MECFDERFVLGTLKFLFCVLSICLFIFSRHFCFQKAVFGSSLSIFLCVVC